MTMDIAANGREAWERPGTPGSLSFLELLAGVAGAGPGIRVTLLAPQLPLGEIPTSIHVETAGRRDERRMRFDHWVVPRQARSLGAQALICPSSSAPLAAPLPVIVVQDACASGPTTVSARWMNAIARAGADRAQVVLTLRDSPAVLRASRVQAVGPWVGEAFSPRATASDGRVRERLGVESGYVLTHADSHDEFKPLISAFAWGSRATGTAHSLVIAGLCSTLGQELQALAAADGVGESIRLLTGLSHADLPALYRGAAVLLHSGTTATGQELRWAMACGLPIAGFTSPPVEAIVADAAYLVPFGDTRLLAAALITLLGEGALAARLRARELELAEAYHDPAALEERLTLLRRVCHPGG